MDFLIKNGTLYDPAVGQLRRGDLALVNGVIRLPSAGQTYRSVIDAAGCIVCPGLVDFHVHYFNGGIEGGVNPDASSFCCGVTTAVDAGSAGAYNYRLFHRGVAAQSDVRLLADLLISGEGQVSFRAPENMEPELFDEQSIKALFRRYPEELVGLKARISNGVVPPGRTPDILRRMVEIADAVETRVIIHVTDPPMPIEEMAALLRPGDVICHIYQKRGQSPTCLDAEGRVRPGLWEARKRGIVFDACNGRGNFDLPTARAAVRQGFVPDVISSDTNITGNFLQPLHSLPRILSKFVDLGMSLEQVLDSATLTPAKLIGRPELGTLEPGTPADVCILKQKQKPMYYEDVNGNTFTGTQVLVPQMTFKGGQCMFCQADFT